MGGGRLLWLSCCFVSNLQALSIKKCSGANPLFVADETREQGLYS